MSVSDACVLNLAETYVQLKQGGAGLPVKVNETFWPEVQEGKRTFDGRMVMLFHIEADSSKWEIHPAGDEIVFPVSGAFDVVCDDGATERRIALHSDGSCLLMPPDVWHRFVVKEPGNVLFVTPRKDTRYRPI